MRETSRERVITMEKRFQLSQWLLRTSCILTEPEDGDIRRVVLGVHGLGGCATDPIQSSLAEEMELFHCATLRFDFPAHGDNPMSDSSFTLDKCIQTLLSVAKWAKARYPQVEDLCIFATGFGAYVTLIALRQLLDLPGSIRLVVQTPSVRFQESLLSMLHITADQLRQEGRHTVQGSRSFSVSYDFYQELLSHEALTSYPIPMLILHGEQDAYIRQEDIRLLRHLNPSSKLVILPGVSHRFLEDGAWDMVLDLTRDWFEFEQVLCCDWE